MNNHLQSAVELLRSLIKTPSLSGDENHTADIIAQYLDGHQVAHQRIGNNIVSFQKNYEKSKKLIVLNSHHDTVKVVSGWTKDPFGAVQEGDRIYGLGSNDAGASLVALINTFVRIYEEKTDYNLVLIASGEEETSGPGGVALALEELGLNPDLAIIGEPTEMHMAIAEKGLMVVDGYAKGVAGHAARDLGDNAVYRAVDDIAVLREIEFERISDLLGETRLTVSQIEGGHQHNIIPDRCHFVVDTRINELYTNQEVLEIMRSRVQSELIPRSLHLSSSRIDPDHPLVKKGFALGRKAFGSPTLSDQVHFECPSMKIGPGISERSHTADEFIRVSEISQALDLYYLLLNRLTI